MRQCNSPKDRLRKLLLGFGVLLLGGIGYAVLCRVTGLGIPCVFHLLTGLKCPGCGISRMCLCLLQGDFVGAWNSNPVILCMLPAGAAMVADYSLRYVKLGTCRPSVWVEVVTWILIVVLLIFAVLRNLPI